MSCAAPGQASLGLAAAGSELKIDFDTLHVSAGGVELSDKVAGLGKPSEVRWEGATARWSFPERGLAASATTDHGRLIVTLTGDKGTVAWPATGSSKTTAFQVPRGEGLNIPANDPFWNSADSHLTDSPLELAGAITMPFWGQTIGKAGVSYLVPTDIGSTLKFSSQHGRLRATGGHDFTEGHEYTVAFSLTDSSPVAAAKDYRRWLAEHGQLSSLEQKIKANPEAGKLIGAFHAYLWGDGRTPALPAKLRELGIDRMWLGYDADFKGVTPGFVKAGKDAGYLVGPYDSYDNAQVPEEADNPTSKWPDNVWPDFCVRKADGSLQTGFGGRGCYVSSKALADAEPTKHYLADRVAKMTGTGVNSYFLDVDAAGELFNDHSKDHPMTKAQDREYKLDRMRKQHGKFVLGSESAGSWANQVLDYSHGSSTPVSPHYWEESKDKANWGAYYPQTAPAFFFKPAKLSDNAVKAMFDPVYRVPLYSTVLHDSVVTTDRWEIDLYKLPAQKRDRVLTAMLYNTPLNLVLDGKRLAEKGTEIAEYQRFFRAIQEKAGTRAMTGFEYLSADKKVQRTTFGDFTITANFGTTESNGVPAGCVVADGKKLCP
ncbi:hypothetical protein D5S17_31050 [Pseudonocardiaceae bacterium YIM PH 21723]|nr:hypothetical protein D5S17_31050 [Pseudonocardiaceae bacterium YIM PH 21723]